jgi:hypothetical protein
MPWNCKNKCFKFELESFLPNIRALVQHFLLIRVTVLIFLLLIQLADAMSNLASTYSALGRLQEALTMQEKVLHFRRHVLPFRHPLIGIAQVLPNINCSAPQFDFSKPGGAMNNIALTHAALGSHRLALLWQDSTLQFFQCVLPENHPDIGENFLACDDLSLEIIRCFRPHLGQSRFQVLCPRRAQTGSFISGTHLSIFSTLFARGSSRYR